MFYRPPTIFQCVWLHLSPPPPASISMMMNTKKHSGKRKSYIPSDHPHNNADRDALKYVKTPSMYGYIKLPIGRPTKTIDSQTIGPSPSTADTGPCCCSRCRRCRRCWARHNLRPCCQSFPQVAGKVLSGMVFSPPWDPIVHDVTRI